MESIVVQKYGGTSVGNIERIFNVANRVIATKNKGNKVVVVVSAMGDTTDELVEKAKQINPNPSNRELDMLLSTGEQISISLLAMAIQSLGHEAISLTGPQCGILTTSNHKNARIEKINSNRIKKELEENKIVIVAGFQGANENGDITTLGRGGSDTSAVALSVAINANKCEIYTDVDGVYTTDPRLVPTARQISKVSYDEMLELASLGAGVLHPRSVELARKYNMTLIVRSSLSNNPGTEVVEVNAMENTIVSGVALDKNIAKISVIEVPDKPGIAFKIFSALASNNIYFDMIIQNVNRAHVNDITFTVKIDELHEALEVTKKISDEIGAKEVLCDESVVKVSIVGTGIAGSADIASSFFQTLYDLGINIQMISTSEIKISCIINEDNGINALNALHEKFCNNNPIEENKAV
ncbi:aspartate kinase LysC [Gottschalkia purinilytica]|uniref:Aspartokinase n=1 Tax=Gottschalkia purinilytica TaxID=1503 RepID=A0A0L0W7N8_GOTPU|nr:aspartate kinase [Gottschalkia purinilytica]KNF07549.1 aspartate kinase LysC [Gottschalkia purinilytica]